MKNIYLILVALLPVFAWTQGGPTCSQMEPICTSTGLTFTANSGVAQASSTDPGNDYDCLSTQPNPTWYYLKIGTSGNIIMNLSASQDIDFVIWGPFSSLSAAQAQCGDLGTPTSEIIDCSYDPSNVETPQILGAVVGQVYVMLITNYANVVQTVSLTQTGGTGATDCSIVTTPPCGMTSLDVNATGCEFATNTYDLNGTVNYTDPPLSGNLMLSVCGGAPTIIASAPFPPNSVNFAVNNLPSTGAPCSVVAYFSSDPTCTQTYNYIAPVCSPNCPTYALNATSPTVTCGNQTYYLEIPNQGCDGTVSFDVVGNYGSAYGSEITWTVTSNQTGGVVSSGGPGTDGGVINTTVGPLDPNVYGNIFTLHVYDSYGDGFNGAGGTITLQQGGSNLATPITGNFGDSSHVMVAANIQVSTTTLTVNTPSGIITSVQGNCNDYAVAIPLANTNFCTPIVVDLPWTIVCDMTGATIASGTQSLTVYPQVPDQASDLVSITWNTSTCQWDVSPNNDCDMLDLGSIFNISPDPTGLANYCANGNQNFTVNYLGVTGSPDCCSTAGPAVPFTYNTSYTKPNWTVQTTPFGGTNNGAYLVIPASGNGGNATSVSLNLSMSGYCFNTPGALPEGAANETYWVTILVDGVVMYDQVSAAGSTSFNLNFNLGNFPYGYNENSVIQVYVYPNTFSSGGTNTTFNPSASCEPSTSGVWTAATLTGSLSAVYDQMVPTPVSCALATTSAYTCCSTGLTADNIPSSSVQCPSDVPAPNIAVVTNIVSSCGATVTHLSDVSSGTCPQTLTRTYRITDACGNILDKTQVFTIGSTVSVTMPANGSSTVSCPANASMPTTPVVTDACGRTLTATFVSSTATPACEGTKTYNFSYTDCLGATYPWSYTYTINYTGGLTPPANTSSTVSCPAAATNPGAPANITDACGRTVSPVLIGSSAAPACEGTVVWTYRYTACDGTTTADWTHTYTINYTGGLTPPANTSSTVTCPAAATDPGAPVSITDACGRTVSPVLIGSSAAPACEGTVVWTYRYTACDGTTTADWTHTYTIDYSGGLTAPANTSSTVTCPAAATNPGAPANITDACGRTVSPVLIGSTAPPACEGTVVWTYRYTACDGTTTADWTHTYTIDYTGALTAPASTSSTVSCPAAATNPGPPANITDACGRTVSPVLIGSTAPPACEGTVVWTYRYTACDGTTSVDWTHTYTIDYSGGLTAPANTSSTVNCPAAATNPGAPANITDACGRTVSAVLIGSTAPPACEGTVVWTYRYTACDGITIADWTHTYTIDYTAGLSAPANTTSTVSCPSAATNPGAPANITDACGRTVIPVLIGSTAAPACEGAVVWTYRYTACDGITTADWTHTYTIDLPTFSVPYANGSATVACPMNATDPGNPGPVVDACGNVLTPVVTAPSLVGCTGGTMDWVYTYTDCAGNTDAWIYSYTVSMPGFVIGTPNGSSVVNCLSAAQVQPTPPVVMDQCGNAVTPVVTSPANIACEGNMVWLFTYTDCAGNTGNWQYTYTIDILPFTVPANGASIVNCLADAQVQPTPPAVTDACGNNLTPAVNAPSAIACEGDMVWTFTYTDCAGNTSDWSYTYTIDIPAFTVPINGASTVNCLANAQVQPVAPAVTDACGNALTPVVTAPANIACEGTMTWLFTYTDCANNSAVWQYTYTIDIPTFTVPANGASTVSCLADAQVQPAAPSVSDACGNALTPVVTAPANISCEGPMTWVFTYTDCAGNTAAWQYTYTIDLPAFAIPYADGASTVACPTDAVDPGSPGVVTDACGNTLSPVVTAPSAVGCAGGTMDWVYTYTDCAGNTDAWTYSYTVNMPPFTLPVNGSSTVNCVADAQVQPSAPTINDQCGNAVAPVVTAPSAIACEGNMTWTFTYTDCAGNTANWTYTYTVDIPAFTISAANGTSTVNCIADAQVQPPAPIVTDQCGNSLTPVVTAPATVACEGAMVWTFTYTDCAGSSASWTHTYTVDVPTFTISTVNGASTVSCPSNALVQPVAPAVTDACGNNLTPAVNAPSAIACEGDMVWTFTYTDCAGNTSDWLYTYTIDIPAFTLPFADGSATVPCPTDATDPGDPGVVTDACGNTLTPVITAPSLVGCSGGVMDWVYTYTDCAGNTVDWTYSYTVSMPAFVINVPNDASTVNCVSDAQVQPTPPVLNDNCGNVITPTVTAPSAIACEGDMVWTFTYTDCSGNTADWLYTYTVDIPVFTIPFVDVSTNVACIGDAVAPGAPGPVTDACGNVITPTLFSTVSTPDPITCAGTIEYVYKFLACDGTAQYWSMIYNISDTIAPTGMAPAAVTVADASQIPLPNASDVTNVADNCTANPIVTFVSDVSDGNPCPETITRTYSITDDCGNQTLVMQTIIVDSKCDIVIPSAFTPNGDGVNDNFEIINIDVVYPDNLVLIFNRWGNQIFESTQGSYATSQWDGTYQGDVMPVGSYYYMILLTGDSKGEILKGVVSIVKK